MDAPIIIVGMSQRVGTHFLYELLIAHPHCAPVAVPRHDWAPRWEDAILAHSDLLERFVVETRDAWNPEYDRDELATSLRQALGEGVLTFLNRSANGGTTEGTLRAVTKHPGTKNLDLFPSFFPGCAPILLVRDGRSVVESAVRGSGITYEAATRRWMRGARDVLDYQARPDGDHLLVRYEDLVADTRSEVRRILKFCQLPPEAYDFDSIEAVPVVGSSFHDGGKGKLNWTPIHRPADFAPTSRHEGWPRRRLQRFDHLAGDHLEALGYDRDQLQATRRDRSKNVALDWLMRRRPLVERLRRRNPDWLL